MRIKLVQDDGDGAARIVDIAGSIHRLDFSGLRGSAAWRIYVVWSNHTACIANVVWCPAAAYRVYTGQEDVINCAQVIRSPNLIVPVVKDRLQRLFWQGKIDKSRQKQPIVLVQPSE